MAEFNKEANDQIHFKIFESLGRIEQQTTEHNHRMTKMEKWRERVQAAAITAGVFMGVVIVPILGWGLWLLVKVQGEFDHQPTTKEEVAKALIELRAEAEKLQIDAQNVGAPGV